MPRVSVNIAMATYNGAAFLEQQLASFTKQDRLPDGLFITDDCSVDRTADVVADFARTTPFPVHFSRNLNRLGFNGNFTHATSLCTADVILFSDQDDVWLPTHVRSLVEPFDNDPRVGLSVSNSTYVDSNLQPTGVDLWTAERLTRADIHRNNGPDQFPAWAKHHAVAGHGMAIRANLRPLLLPFGPGWVYDHWVALLSVACSRAVIVDAPLTLHRKHANQSVANDVSTLAAYYQATPQLDADHFDRQIEKWRTLRDRLTAPTGIPIFPSVFPTIDARIAFLQWRQAHRHSSAPGRILRALGGLTSGKYHRFGRGLLTFARDAMG